MRKKPQTILWEESDKYKRGCASDIPAQWHNIAINSMEVFAEEEAISFAEWASKNFNRSYPKGETEALWFVNGYNPKFQKKHYTTKELYDIFKDKG